MTKRTPSRFSDMTIRQIAEKLSIPVEGRQLGYAVLEWELFSEDPKLKHITDRMLDEFEISMTTRGLAPTTAATWRRRVQNIIKRAQQGADWLHHRAPAGTARKTTPNRIDGTLLSYYSVQYRPKRLAGKSIGTHRLFIYHLKQFDEFLGRPARLDDLTDEAVLGAMEMLREQGLSAKTTNRMRQCVLAIWRFLFGKRIVDTLPDVPKFPEPESVPFAWSEAQVKKIFQSAARETGTIAGIPRRDWWIALLSVALDTAERKTALLSLRWDDIDLANGFVTFQAATRKGGRKANVQRLSPDTIDSLRRIQKHGSDVVFPWPYTPTFVYHHLKRILRRAKLPTGRNTAFHCWRKTCASHVRRLGGDATAALRHASPRTTALYIDPRVAGEMFAADILAQSFRPTEGLKR